MNSIVSQGLYRLQVFGKLCWRLIVMLGDVGNDCCLELDRMGLAEGQLENIPTEISIVESMSQGARTLP